jgi:hypothetical protein
MRYDLIRFSYFTQKNQIEFLAVYCNISQYSKYDIAIYRDMVFTSDTQLYLWSQILILPRLSRSAVKFPVCLIFLALLRHQLTPAAIYTHYNYVIHETLA